MCVREREQWGESGRSHGVGGGVRERWGEV